MKKLQNEGKSKEEDKERKEDVEWERKRKTKKRESLSWSSLQEGRKDSGWKLMTIFFSS